MENFEKEGDIFNCKLLLEDGTYFTIPMREDGYIFATALCKAVGKRVNHWLRLKETKNLVKELEKSDMLITASQLIEIYKGNTSRYNQGTWIHPDLGIQLAQWCSPNFSLQVSKWIKELVITKKVELGKEKTDSEIYEEFLKIKKQLEEQILLNQELENKNQELENKNQELENKNQENLIIIETKSKNIQFLENKIERAQKRETYPDNNVVYLITSEELKKEGTYIVGKAVDLKTRLTTYNKSMEHEVIYYKSFKNMYQMRVAEMMVLYKLHNYLCKNKKERLILPESKDISLFTNAIDEAYNWFENIEDIMVKFKTTNTGIKKKNNKNNKKDKQIKVPKKGEFEKNTVYMLSSKFHKEKRTYIIGKTKDLNFRLNAYNKGLEHDVIYYKKCKNIKHMDIIELMILYKLDNYRERANRDRFILPEDQDINLFTNIFDEAVNWFKNIDENVVIFKSEETKKIEIQDSRKTYRELNKEKIAEDNKKYREKNKEKLKEKKKEYIENNKEKVSNTKKEWYKKNKEKVVDRIKKNYENNKEEKIAKVKEYAEKNQEKIKERRSITMTCECGSTFQKYGIKKHLGTQIHLDYLKKNKIIET